MTEEAKSFDLGFGAERMRPEGEPPTLFRKRYRPLTEPEGKLHDAIKDKADELARLFTQIPTTTNGPLPPPAQDPLGFMTQNRGANVTLALRHLEDAVYRAVKALTT